MKQVRVVVRHELLACLTAAALLGAGCATDDDRDRDGDGRIIGAAAEGSAGAGEEAEAPSFGEVYAIMEQSCGGGMSGCHITGMSAGLAMPDSAAAHTSLVNVASGKCDGAMLVVPGDAEASVLVHVLEGTSACVKAMPLGREALAAADVELVRAWIDSGAAGE